MGRPPSATGGIVRSGLHPAAKIARIPHGAGFRSRHRQARCRLPRSLGWLASLAGKRHIPAAGSASAYNTKIVKEFRAKQGRVGGLWAGIPLILIHHIGARSGIERVDPVAYYPQPGGRFAIWAANGDRPPTRTGTTTSTPTPRSPRHPPRGLPVDVGAARRHIEDPVAGSGSPKSNTAVASSLSSARPRGEDRLTVSPSIMWVGLAGQEAGLTGDAGTGRPGRSAA